MRYQFLASMICLALAGLGCDGSAGGDGSRLPAGPSPTPTPAPAPVPPPNPVTFPSITVGEVVRFQFTADNLSCSGCRSYNVTAPSDGRLDVVVTPVSLVDTFLRLFEMYLVPGADSWNTGPGRRISVTAQVRAGRTYEIRMYYPVPVPSEELELRASLQ